jgi:hypothetical protein
MPPSPGGAALASGLTGLWGQGKAGGDALRLMLGG